ncbi:MAG TPA: tyrosine-type recombinase/integrase [Conexibacter sp.]|nr:tyrosine-type recombinase/integrase [Conexibacter sp.]
MSVQRTTRRSGGRVFRVRWRENGRQCSRTFDRKPDAEAWDREVKRRQQLGPLAVQQLTDRSVTLGEWIIERWTPEHGVTLERSTRTRYANVHALHIAPILDDVPLNAMTVGVLRRWQARLVAEGMKPGSVHKCRTFLSSVLRHAAEAEAIPANPLTLVRAPRAEHHEQVRPLAPPTVERIRAALHAEGAAIVSVLAYAGLRPGELRALRWGDVRERTILVQRGADPDGKTKPTKTRAARTVRLLAPLAADLKEWRMASGRPGDDALVFPGKDGGAWTKDEWDVFRRRAWSTASKRAGLVAVPRPYDLRHSFASLLLAEGRTVHYVAAQLGHSPALTLSTYGHLIAEYADAGPIDAEQEIAKARADGYPVDGGDRTLEVVACIS